MFGHLTDVGGKVPGSLPTDSGSIFEEGFRFPPVKLYRRGELQTDIVRIAAHQSRMPEWFKADLHAIVAACRVGGRRDRGERRAAVRGLRGRRGRVFGARREPRR